MNNVTGCIVTYKWTIFMYIQYMLLGSNYGISPSSLSEAEDNTMTAPFGIASQIIASSLGYLENS